VILLSSSKKKFTFFFFFFGLGNSHSPITTPAPTNFHFCQPFPPLWTPASTTSYSKSLISLVFISHYHECQAKDTHGLTSSVVIPHSSHTELETTASSTQHREGEREQNIDTKRDG